MISRKGQKTVNEGVVGKYIKKDTPPDLPSMSYMAYYDEKSLVIIVVFSAIQEFIFLNSISISYLFNYYLLKSYKAVLIS